MTPTKPAGHEDVPENVPEDVKKLAWMIANEMASGQPDDAPTAALEFAVAFDTAKRALLADRSRRAKAPAEATSDTEPLTVEYTNYRGEHSTRILRPRAVWFGSTDWHPEPQWLLKAWDVEKAAERDFALKDFGPAPAQAPELAPDVKGLVERLREPRGPSLPGSALAMEWLRANWALREEAADALSRLSAPPAEAPSAYLSATGIPEFPARYPVDWRAHPAEPGLTPLYKHPSPPAEAAIIDEGELRRRIHDVAGCHEHSIRTDRLVGLFYSLGAPPPAEAKPVAWSVKPLEWTLHNYAYGNQEEWVASGVCDFHAIVINRGSGGWQIIGDKKVAPLEEQQARVQAKYEQSIFAVITPDPRAKAAEAVPEGMVLVPREITPEMQHAYFDVIDRNMPRVQTDAKFGRHDSQIEAYRAMLAAAPQPLSTAAVK